MMNDNIIMCGIVGYLGTESDANQAVLHGIHLLQNRGYDSAGISSIIDGELRTIKRASTDSQHAIDILNNIFLYDNPQSTLSIGHTRWATHGSKTDMNAHPHHDRDDRLALVHNGIIENFQEIKSGLVKKGYSFKSSTDSEVVAVLIGSFLDEGKTMLEAVQMAVHMCHGTWALVIIHRDYPNKMWAVRNGSPLLLGSNTQCVMVVSESIAFSQHINHYIVLNDHDVLEIELSNDGEFVYNKSLSKYLQKMKITDGMNELTCDPWPHWMMKEIMEQPDAILRAMNNGGRISSETTVKLGGLDTYLYDLKRLDHLILLGCGTSYHAGLWSLDIFKSLDIFDTVSLYDGADFSAKDVPKKGDTGVVFLSQSGETKDLQRCIQIIHDKGLLSIGIVNVIDSFIARETICGVYLNAGREVAVASTKSFTSQCVVLAILAVWFSQHKKTCLEKRRKMIRDLHQLPIQISSVLEPANLEKIKGIAESWKQRSSAFLLGKGKEEAIAKEGALKLKEIAQIHAEGYSTSALKHGPFGLLEPGLPVLFFDVSDKHRDKTANAIQEVGARNADIYLLSDKSEESLCVIDSNATFGGLITNVCVQLLAYYCACHKGISPDYPRNLAKVVTVE
jgi:glucosamine--fructose-6-phosphate aminotransferase (isomerizing)